MNKIRIMFCFFILTGFLPVFTGVSSAGEVYRLSMLPRYFSPTIKAVITPLAEYLSKETGEKIIPVLTQDFNEYENRVKNGEIEIGYEDPLIYTKISGIHQALAMSLKGKGKEQFRGIIITQPDSNIHSINDLKHKTIMIAGKDSVGGFLSQKLFLSRNGIDVEQDCDLVTASENKQENVVLAVSIWDVDAGFIQESSLHIADQYIPPNSLNVLVSCAWLPNWAMSVSKSLPESLKTDILSALLALNKDPSMLKAIKVTGFKPAEDKDYDVIRSLL